MSNSSNFLGTYTKQSAEVEIIYVNFARRVPLVTGESGAVTIIEGTVDVEEYVSKYNDSSTPVVITGETITGTILSALVGGGISGNSYNLVYTVRLSNGEVKQENILLRISDV